MLVNQTILQRQITCPTKTKFERNRKLNQINRIDILNIMTADKTKLSLTN